MSNFPLSLGGKGLVVQKGGVDAILRGMRLHEGVAAVHAEACEALWTLAENKGNTKSK